MKTVVITGSTRGIGYALADAFLARGCKVVISGRFEQTVQQAVKMLGDKYSAELVTGYPCDVSDFAQVEALWKSTTAHFGVIDIWINNAGQANILTPFWELTPEKMRSVVESNVLGSMFGSKVALQGMLAQGSGAMYNMEGFGSRGRRVQLGLTLYGTTKAALSFLDKSLTAEIANTSVIVGSILPGMVITAILLDQRGSDPANWERSKRIYNILADRAEDVAPWIVERVLANKKNGAQITWLNGAKVTRRFLTAPFRKRRLVE